MADRIADGNSLAHSWSDKSFFSRKKEEKRASVSSLVRQLRIVRVVTPCFFAAPESPM